MKVKDGRREKLFSYGDSETFFFFPSTFSRHWVSSNYTLQVMRRNLQREVSIHPLIEENWQVIVHFLKLSYKLARCNREIYKAFNLTSIKTSQLSNPHQVNKIESQYERTCFSFLAMTYLYLIYLSQNLWLPLFYKLLLNKFFGIRPSSTSLVTCRVTVIVRRIGVRDHIQAPHLDSHINIPYLLKRLAMRDDWCLSVTVTGNRAWWGHGGQ